MKVSIIIAVKEPDSRLDECLRACLSLDFADYEILVLPDQDFACAYEKARVIPTGACLPAQKRDMACAAAGGEILAFLDDDAYPAVDWLKNAVTNFDDQDVAAVGGPAVTPPDEKLPSAAGGLVYEAWLVSGNFRYRYRQEKRQLVEDYPSCNLLVRKDIFQKAGGFKTDFWPGEDTILCLEITRGLRKKIVYDPRVLVFHHRRPLFLPHLRQIANYALHRGYFVKRFPQTSLRLSYFIPSALLLWIIAGLGLSLANRMFFSVYVFSLVIYAMCVILSGLSLILPAMGRQTFLSFSLYGGWNKVLSSPQCGGGKGGGISNRSSNTVCLVVFGIFLTHFCYGLYFIRGLLKSRLREEK